MMICDVGVKKLINLQLMYYKNVNTKSTSTPVIDIEDLKAVGRITAKNWYIVVGLVLLSFGISYLYTYKLTNVFGAQTQLIMETNDKVNEQSIINENFGSYYNWWNQSNVENITAMRVIKSFDLVENAVSRLKLDVSYYIVGRIKTTEIYNAIPYEVNVLAINSRFYEREMDFQVLDEHTYQIELNINGEKITKKGFFDKEYIDSDVKLLVKNNTLTKENVSTISTIHYKIIIHDTPTLVYRFQDALSVENPDGTNILQLRLEDVIPERAKAFLDTLTTVYIQNSLKTRLNVNTNTLNYIERQMNEVTDMLKNIEDSLQTYKENKSILDLNREEEDYFKKMSSYDGQRSKLNLELKSLNSLEKYIIEDKDPQFLPPDVYVVSDDGFLKQSITDLYNFQIKENQNLNIATKDNHAVIEEKQRIKKLKSDLLIYINNSKRAINDGLNDIEEQIQFYISSIKSIPKKQREMLGIQRNLDVNQKMYLFLLEKKSNTIIGRAGILPQIKVIETARNIGIIRPDKKKIQMSFLVVSLIIALVLIFIRSVFFAHIESLEELKRKTIFPILGEVIASPSAANWTIAVEKGSKSLIAESFRTIRTNLQFMAPDNVSKMIVITSNNPGEGKTFTSLNLAAILAKADKKVLILELDLHKPKIQKALNMVADVGISTILIGKSTIEESVKETRIENMYTILSGPIPPNPSEMILSKSLDKILEYAKEHFDYTIIDTPPIGLISDALVLMKKADVSLFVLNTKFAAKETIQNVKDVVEMHQLKHFGFILNGVKVKRSRYYYSRNAYGYYGYSYGYTEDSKRDD
jgi:capsular exopolysaccharide synthesis family protein